ncbi:NAD(P)H-binding protein [Winogradskyella sp.]|uniref:NAD(P)H-binding protein n=1 Tax=Winogradskyella sp. TaxID=1883156 RepID=UPI00261E1087|nr:NAD(P)H-binding protein [Winogradskyella sp.]
MKKVIITGATGMVGSIVLQHCLKNNQIEKVISITRRETNIKDEKLIEVIHKDFLNYENIKDQFKDIDIAYFCIGVYTGAVPDVKFKEITVDYTKTFVNMLKRESPKARLCFLSGAGADCTEKSRTSFARYKGMAENFMANSGLEFYSFRPAYIFPVKKRKEPNLMYTISRSLYPIIKLFGKNASIKSTELAKAMFQVGLTGAEKSFLENKDILKLIK